MEKIVKEKRRVQKTDFIESQVLTPLFTKSQVEKALQALSINYDANDINRLRYGKPSRMFEDVEIQPGVFQDLKLELKLQGSEVISLFHFRKNKLEIPESIGDRKITDDEYQKLVDGDFIPFDYKGKSMFLMIDKDLNKLIIKNETDIKVPLSIQNVPLSQEEKAMFSSHQLLPTKVFYNEESQEHFMVNIRLSEDNRTLEFQNYKPIAPEKVEEYKKRFNQPFTKPQVLKNSRLKNLSDMVDEIVSKSEPKKIVEPKANNNSKNKGIKI